MSWLDYFTWPREAISNIERDVATLKVVALEQTTRLNRMKELIMATAEDLAARIDAATNEVASDLQAVKDELAAALATSDADKQAAVDAALAKLDAPIARLESLGADNANPVPPVDQPPVDEPPAEEPPADNGDGGDTPAA